MNIVTLKRIRRCNPRKTRRTKRRIESRDRSAVLIGTKHCLQLDREFRREGSETGVMEVWKWRKQEKRGGALDTPKIADDSPDDEANR